MSTKLSSREKKVDLQSTLERRLDKIEQAERNRIARHILKTKKLKDRDLARRKRQRMDVVKANLANLMGSEVDKSTVVVSEDPNKRK